MNKDTFQDICVVVAMLLLVFVGIGAGGIVGIGLAILGGCGIYRFIKELIKKENNNGSKN